VHVRADRTHKKSLDAGSPREALILFNLRIPAGAHHSVAQRRTRARNQQYLPFWPCARIKKPSARTLALFWPQSEREIALYKEMRGVIYSFSNPTRAFHHLQKP